MSHKKNDIPPLEPACRAPLKEHPDLGSQYALCSLSGAVYYRLAQLANYERRYFLTQYREQYGCSYMEDEAALRQLAQRRLKLIDRYPPPGRRLLEIGAAAGFFLDEAHRHGFEVSGLECSRFAAQIARKRFGLSIHCASFPQYKIGRHSFDLIAAFYLLEHLPQQHSALKAIAEALQPGGLFLFALPSLQGPLFRRHREQWLREHPKDHFVDHSPASLRKCFSYYGLKLLLLRPASFHPERAGSLWKYPLLRQLYRLYALKRCYGDTMEGIARRSL